MASSCLKDLFFNFLFFLIEIHFMQGEQQLEDTELQEKEAKKD